MPVATCCSSNFLIPPGPKFVGISSLVENVILLIEQNEILAEVLCMLKPDALGYPLSLLYLSATDLEIRL
jgi:hypothetical protein